MFKVECERDDCAISASEGMSTLVYYVPIYNKHGENINPDMNTKSGSGLCNKCKRQWIYKTVRNETTVTEVTRDGSNTNASR